LEFVQGIGILSRWVIPIKSCPLVCRKGLSGREFAQEFLFVHAVLEGFFAVDEDDRNFVVEAAADFFVGVDVNFLSGEARALGKFC